MIEMETEVLTKETKRVALQAGRYMLDRSGLGVVEMEVPADPGNFIQSRSTILRPEFVAACYAVLDTMLDKELLQDGDYEAFADAEAKP